jgi:hypothetical protein
MDKSNFRMILNDLKWRKSDWKSISYCSLIFKQRVYVEHQYRRWNRRSLSRSALRLRQNGTAPRSYGLQCCQLLPKLFDQINQKIWPLAKKFGPS